MICLPLRDARVTSISLKQKPHMWLLSSGTTLARRKSTTLTVVSSAIACGAVANYSIMRDRKFWTYFSTTLRFTLDASWRLTVITAPTIQSMPMHSLAIRSAAFFHNTRPEVGYIFLNRTTLINQEEICLARQPLIGGALHSRYTCASHSPCSYFYTDVHMGVMRHVCMRKVTYL